MSYSVLSPRHETRAPPKRTTAIARRVLWVTAARIEGMFLSFIFQKICQNPCFRSQYADIRARLFILQNYKLFSEIYYFTSHFLPFSVLLTLKTECLPTIFHKFPLSLPRLYRRFSRTSERIGRAGSADFEIQRMLKTTVSGGFRKHHRGKETKGRSLSFGHGGKKKAEFLVERGRKTASGAHKNSGNTLRRSLSASCFLPSSSVISMPTPFLFTAYSLPFLPESPQYFLFPIPHLT